MKNCIICLATFLSYYIVEAQNPPQLPFSYPMTPTLNFIISKTLNKYPNIEFKISKDTNNKPLLQLTNYDSLNTGEFTLISWINSLPNKPDGEISIVDKNAIKRYQVNYIDGNRQGMEFYWFKSGKLKCANRWNSGLLIKGKCFYESGNLQSIFNSTTKSKQTLFSYYPNGQLICFYDKDKKIEFTYFENGSIKTQRNRKRNSYLENHPNGTLKMKGKIQKDQWKRKGKWLYYNQNGSLIKVFFYKKENIGWYNTEVGWHKKKEYQRGNQS